MVAVVIFLVSILAIIELKRSTGDLRFCLLVLFELLLLFCDFVVVGEDVNENEEDEEEFDVETLVFLTCTTCFFGVSGFAEKRGGGGGGKGV